MARTGCFVFTLIFRNLFASRNNRDARAEVLGELGNFYRKDDLSCSRTAEQYRIVDRRSCDQIRVDNERTVASKTGGSDATTSVAERFDELPSRRHVHRWNFSKIAVASEKHRDLARIDASTDVHYARNGPAPTPMTIANCERDGFHETVKFVSCKVLNPPDGRHR